MAVYFFDNAQEILKIIPDSATISSVQTQELPEDGGLMKDILEVTVKGDEALSDVKYMAVKSYEGNDQAFDMYQIVSDVTPDSTMSFTGVSLATYELEGYIIQDIRPNNANFEDLLARLLRDSDWRVGWMDENIPAITTNFYYVSVKEALKAMQGLAGVEFVFKVEISGQQITDKWVEVYHQMGNRTKKRFNYGTNALTVVREGSKAELYTALIGRGKGEKVSNAEDNESGQAGYGRKITFDEIEWKKSNGDPLDKPRGQYYLEMPEATNIYGIQKINGDMTPRVGVVDFDDEEDVERLLRLTYEQLKVTSRPKVLFKASVVNIGATGIGDTVTIHRHDLNIHYETRVRKVVRNKLNDNKTQVELGDAVVTPSTRINQKINANIQDVSRELDRVRTEVTETRRSLGGDHNVSWGAVEPEQKRTNDIWYRPHPSLSGETQMLVWDGNNWELVLDTSDTTKVAREIEEQIQKLESFEQSLKELQDRNDEELAEFDKQLEELRQSGVSEEQIDEAIKRAGFDSVEIEEIQRRLDESVERAELGSVEIENLRRRLGETSDTAELAVEMIGNDGKMRYSRNRVDGATDGQVEFGGQPLEVTHNGEGFVAGQTYTISFDALCELLEQIGVDIRFNYPTDVTRSVTVTFKPDEPLFDTVEQTVESQFRSDIFKGYRYTMTIESDWYKSTESSVESEADIVEVIDLAFKDIVAGDLTSDRILNWDNNPELVIKGVM